MLIHRIAFLTSIACLLGLCAELRADEIVLRGGRVIEGRVVSREGKKVRIERPYGFITIAADRIVEVRETEDVFDHFDRLQKQFGDSMAERLALAKWCRTKGLRHRMKEIVDLVLEEEPDLAEAREFLGQVKTERGWESKARLARLERQATRRVTAKEKAHWARVEREMRRLAAGIYAADQKNGERAYLKLLALAEKEKIGGLKPIAARFHRDATRQRAAIAQARVDIRLQQATVTSLRERSLSLGTGNSVRVQLPETRKIGIGTTVAVPLR